MQSCLDYLSNLALISQGGQEIAVTLQEILGIWNFVICKPYTRLKKRRQMSSWSCLSELCFAYRNTPTNISTDSVTLLVDTKNQIQSELDKFSDEVRIQYPCINWVVHTTEAPWHRAL